MVSPAQMGTCPANEELKPENAAVAMAIVVVYSSSSSFCAVELRFNGGFFHNCTSIQFITIYSQ